MNELNYSYIVVEDEMEVCKQIQIRMNKFPNWECLGLIPFYAEALNLIHQKKPNLLFLDYSIRGGNTFSLLDEIYKMENYEPYIIFFTAFQSDNPEIPEEAINNHKVNKYLIKPIFEKLTLYLEEYLLEAEKWIIHHEKIDFWIETILKQKIKINPQEIVCIVQSETNSRNKLIRTSNNDVYEIRASWDLCEKMAHKYNVDYCFANARDSLINKKFITKLQKPKVWLNNQFWVEVTKDKWKEVEKS
jgi:two-component system, LytTR family, response regulator